MSELYLFSDYNHFLAIDPRIQQKSAEVLCETQLTVWNFKGRIVDIIVICKLCGIYSSKILYQ